MFNQVMGNFAKKKKKLMGNLNSIYMNLPKQKITNMIIIFQFDNTIIEGEFEPYTYLLEI